MYFIDIISVISVYLHNTHYQYNMANQYDQ